VIRAKENGWINSGITPPRDPNILTFHGKSLTVPRPLEWAGLLSTYSIAPIKRAQKAIMSFISL
jgi:hypothetical protein